MMNARPADETREKKRYELPPVLSYGLFLGGGSFISSSSNLPN